jgi:3-hydroxybutyryl-CoA dehydrogenase
MYRVGVIGAGTMGNGIAHVSALSGLDVVLVDINAEFLQKGLAVISKNMDRQVEKDKISNAEKSLAMDRIAHSTEMNSLADCDIVVEAATENPKVKASIFKQLDGICKSDCILASNTSSISITEIASNTNRPERVIGMHFMNPVPVMKLIEVIRGHLTSDETASVVQSLSIKMNKIAVECNDYPGFVANRILMPMINEAIFCLMEGVAEAQAIDDIMKLGMAHPMGPLTLADLIGLDVCLGILEVLHRELGDSKYRPCPLLKKMVASGTLGRKTRHGFFNYK